MVRAIRFEIESQLANVALAAQALRGLCGLVALGADRVDELELAFVEAINNIIEHGYEGRAEMSITVDAKLHADRILVRISDRGARIPADVLERARGTVLQRRPRRPRSGTRGRHGSQADHEFHRRRHL